MRNMVNSFQAVAVLLLALLPGARYVWGFEREAGQWGISAGWLEPARGREAGPAGSLRRYAAGFPHPQDLWLAQAIAVDPTTGEFVRDQDGDVVGLQSGLLVRFDDVEVLHFFGTTQGVAMFRRAAQSRPDRRREGRGGYPADPTPVDVRKLLANLPDEPALGAATSNGTPASGSQSAGQAH
jgi:hypothetical protein